MLIVSIVFLLCAPALGAAGEDAAMGRAFDERAATLLRERQAAVSALKTPEQVRARQEVVRKRMTELIGGLPAKKTPLNAKVTSGFARDGYRVENVVFESQPGFRVTANLYLPQSEGPAPAVLGVAGHSASGKAYAVYQQAWIGLVERGYVVLAYDPPGQGERQEYFDADLGQSKVGIGVAEHIMAGEQCLLTGSTFARYEIWDGIRAFDYLLTRHEVDPKRIAVAGNSGGGTQAAYLAVFEPRLAAAVSSCYMTGWKELWSDPGPQDAEQLFQGFIASGFNFGDFAIAGAPRPFLMTTAIQDFFPIAGARATYHEIERIYEVLGASERAGYFEYDDHHGWSKPRREAAYRFLDKWLQGKSTDGAEPEIETELESRLLVTPTGQLATSFGSETVQSLNLRLAEELAARRGAVTRERLAARLGVRWTPLPANPASGGKPAVLTLGLPRADVEDLKRTGALVIPVEFPDLPEGPLKLGDYSPAYQIAGRAWLLGSSIPTVRVQQVLEAFRDARSRADVDGANVDGANVGIIGRGSLGPVALMAAVLEPAIRKVALEHAVVSYMDVVSARIHRAIEPIIVPGALEDFDLPDLGRLVAPRALWLVSPILPNGAPSREAARSYPNAKVLERGEAWPASKIYTDWMR
jgi:pimeloyl-ACP methyl ester carboxylesterase